MEENRWFVYFSHMKYGDRETSLSEKRMHGFFVDIQLCQRMTLTPEFWNFDVLSPFWRMYLVDGPGGCLDCSGLKYELEFGFVYLVPAWVPFRTSTTRTMTQIFVHFYLQGLPPTWVKKIFQAPLKREIGPMAVIVFDLEASFELPGDETFTRFNGVAALIHATFMSGVRDLAPDRRAEFQLWLATPPEVGAALEAIENNLAHAPKNPALAALCGMGEDKFVRRFEAYTGLTPAQYRLERRVTAAAGWLTLTGQSIEQIAEAAGFIDRFAFTKAFTRRFGLGPAAYRRLHTLEQGGVTP